MAANGPDAAGLRRWIEPGQQSPAVGSPKPDRERQRRMRTVDLDTLKPLTGQRLLVANPHSRPLSQPRG